jgi:hypothetical protein
MKIIILGAQQRLHSMCGENQPDEDSRLDSRMSDFRGTLIIRPKNNGSRLQRTAATESQKRKAKSRP